MREVRVSKDCSPFPISTMHLDSSALRWWSLYDIAEHDDTCIEIWVPITEWGASGSLARGNSSC